MSQQDSLHGLNVLLLLEPRKDLEVVVRLGVNSDQ